MHLVHPDLVLRGEEAQRTMAASDADGAAAVTASATTSATAVTARAAGAVAAAPATPVGAAAAQPHLPEGQQQQEQQRHQQQPQPAPQPPQPAPQPQPADPAAALREAVQLRFPYTPHDTAQHAGRHRAQRLEVEAKREAALVLATTGAGALPPLRGAAARSQPFELPLTQLCVATYAELRGARPARKLRDLLEEEPGAFSMRFLVSLRAGEGLWADHVVGLLLRGSP